MGSLNKCEIIDGQKVLTPFVETNNGIINGMPLGSWISFEKDAAPNEEWIQAGTTFDADKYPELYLFLGGNVVPSRYDHSRPNYTNVYKGHMAITTVAPTKTQLFEATQSDGVLNVSIYDNGSTAGQVTNRNMVFYVNGSQITESSICSNPAYSGNPYLYRLTLNKGDIVQVARATSNVANDIQLTVSWIPYSHPMFIKASSATSIYTPSDAVRQVKDYVADYVDERIADTGSYSLDEIDTGKKWINGSPIYRKVISIPYLPNQEINRSYPHGITGLTWVTNLSGVAHNLNTPNKWWNITDARNEPSLVIELSADANNIYISTYTDRTNTTARIYIEYLKG